MSSFYPSSHSRRNSFLARDTPISLISRFVVTFLFDKASVEFRQFDFNLRSAKHVAGFALFLGSHTPDKWFSEHQIISAIYSRAPRSFCASVPIPGWPRLSEQ